MKTRRFDFNWKPLQLQISLAVEGSVPDQQNYNADTKEFTPDYTITPVVIQPVISILDKDAVLQAGRVNQSLTNIRWYEIINGTKTLIASDNASYEITTSGGNAGRIKVKFQSTPLREGLRRTRSRKYLLRWLSMPSTPTHETASC